MDQNYATITTTVSNLKLFRLAKKESLDIDNNTIYFNLNNIVEKKHYDRLSKIYDEEILVKIRARKGMCAENFPLYFAGYGVAYARSKSSGASTFKGVEKLKGTMYSDGSNKYYYVNIDQDTVFELPVSRSVLKNLSDQDNEFWEVLPFPSDSHD